MFSVVGVLVVIALVCTLLCTFTRLPLVIPVLLLALVHLIALLPLR